MTEKVIKNGYQWRGRTKLDTNGLRATKGGLVAINSDDRGGRNLVIKRLSRSAMITGSVVPQVQDRKTVAAKKHEEIYSRKGYQIER
ncbi:hypothetical protein NA78x_003033 [Anatilimnocola sp. NA78]|uniref:hypothetical protein n=1 Tax=Anatilimnocola sp. NA78 TaxID=3415683 RepID=UPI003CE56372